MNSSFKRFSTKYRGLLPELQCFARVFISAPVRQKSDNADGSMKFKNTEIDINSWTSLSMPSPSIAFKSDSSSLYKPIFAGISTTAEISVGYQDFNDLHITTALWAFYASQFTDEGFLIKGSSRPDSTVTYQFYSFYDSTKKDFSDESSFLWSVHFTGVVFKEPQLTGLSPTMGNLNRSFQFMYERFEVWLPPYKVAILQDQEDTSLNPFSGFDSASGFA